MHYRRELENGIRRELRKLNVPHVKWDGAFIVAGVFEDSGGQLTISNRSFDLYTPLCRLSMLAGAMTRRLLWTLWTEELSPRDTILRSLKWNHMIFGTGKFLHGLNEKLSEFRGTIYLLVTGYFGVASPSGKEGCVAVLRKDIVQRATQPDTVLVLDGKREEYIGSSAFG